MNPTTGGGAYHPKPPHSEGSARDAKDQRVTFVVQRSAESLDRKVAPSAAPTAAPTAAPSREAAPSKLLTEWAKAPKPRSLEEGMQLAAKIDRVTQPFSSFVQKACPSLSKVKFAKAVEDIVSLAPEHSLDTDEEAVEHMTNFLPPPEVWENDGLTPVARAEHLMWVLTSCVLNVEMRESGLVSDQLKFTARALWSIHNPLTRAIPPRR